MKHANTSNAVKIKRVNLTLGELAGIVDKCISLYWDIIAKDTIAEGAELDFVRVQAEALCAKCKRQFEVKEFNLTCPDCGTVSSELVAGREFRVESIEVE